MNYEQAKEALKAYLPDYLDRQGITPNREGNILCINPEHPDTNPSMHIYPDRVKCFSCGKSYDLMDCIGILEGIPTFSGQLHRAADLYGITLDEPAATVRPQAREIHDGETIPDPRTDTQPQEKPQPARPILPELWSDFKQWAYNLEADPEAMGYLEARGLSLETRVTYMLGHNPAWKASGNRGTWRAITIPTSPRTVAVRNMDPEAGKKDRYDINPGAEKNLYPWGYMHEERRLSLPVIVCEGYFDALAIIQSNGNAVAIEGTGDSAIVSFLQDPRNRNGRPVIIALDNDEPGRRGAEQLEKDLTTIPGLQVYRENIAGPYKDPGERLAKDPAGLAEAVAYCNAIEENKKREAAEKYRKENSATGKMGAFHEIVQKNKKEARISTGFKKIDEAMGGGLFPGVITIGAISGGGKTTWLLQCACNIAAAGHDVIYISLEMPEHDLLAKTISRHTYEISKERNMPAKYARKQRDILLDRADSQTSRALVEDAEARLLKYSDHLFIKESIMRFNVFQVKEAVKKHKEYTGKAPVLCIDYVQILSATDPRQTDKMKLDEAITNLKLISNEFNIPVIVLSSISRGDGYNGPITMSMLKESGGLEFTSDIVIGLQYAGVERKLFKGDDGKFFWEKNDAYTARIAELTSFKNINKRLEEGLPIEMEMKFLKNRSDQKDGVRLDYYPQYNFFEDYARELREGETIHTL